MVGKLPQIEIRHTTVQYPQCPITPSFSYTQSFSKPAQQRVQAKGWRDSITQLCVAALPRPTKAQAETIKSVAQSLETVNPTQQPALSPYVDGQWRLLYSNSPGVSSGRVGPFTGRVYQDVDLDKKECEYINIGLLFPCHH